jgi:hypothetical protein
VRRNGILFRVVSKTWFAAILLISILLLAGCSSSNNSSGSGTLGVSLTDAPACGFDSVNVTVSKVRVHQSSSATENDAGWTDIILTPARKINLLDLTNGALEDFRYWRPALVGHNHGDPACYAERGAKRDQADQRVRRCSRTARRSGAGFRRVQVHRNARQRELRAQTGDQGNSLCAERHRRFC